MFTEKELHDLGLHTNEDMGLIYEDGICQRLDWANITVRFDKFSFEPDYYWWKYGTCPAGAD